MMKKRIPCVLLSLILFFGIFPSVIATAESEIIPESEHTLTHVQAKAATDSETGNVEYWVCSVCGKYYLDEEATRETTAEKVVRKFAGYRHDPAANVGAMKDIVVDANAVYGFRPSESGSLKQYADMEWDDPVAVEGWRQDRIAYHQSLSSMYDLAETMLAEGKSVEEIARAVSAKRNELRLAAYTDDPEGLALAKERNLEKYGHEEGPLPDELYAQYGSWETVMEKAFSANLGMDACLGLYDDYYPVYVLLNQANPVAYVMALSSGVYNGDSNGLVFISSADFADFLAVRIDGAIIDPAYYTAEAGSTKVTLKSSYLDTLTEAAHTISIVSNDGEASANFTIVRDTLAPKTGEGSAPLFYIALAFLSLFVMAGTGIRKDRTSADKAA